jgi:hypothetical protein
MNVSILEHMHNKNVQLVVDGQKNGYRKVLSQRLYTHFHISVTDYMDYVNRYVDWFKSE